MEVPAALSDLIDVPYVGIHRPAEKLVHYRGLRDPFINWDIKRFCKAAPVVVRNPGRSSQLYSFTNARCILHVVSNAIASNRQHSTVLLLSSVSDKKLSRNAFVFCTYKENSILLCI